MFEQTVIDILNKHNICNEIITDFEKLKNDRYVQWSGLKSFNDAIPDITHGRPGNYQIIFKDRIVYFGTTNSNKGKSSYGLHDRIQKKKTIINKHYNNKEKIFSLKESCMKKAFNLGYLKSPDLWNYRFIVLPIDIPLILEIKTIRKLKEAGYCELNDNRTID